MPRRGMGVEIQVAVAELSSPAVMPRRGMGVEIQIGETLSSTVVGHAPQGHGSRNNYRGRVDERFDVMPRRGMGVEIVQ